MKFDKQLKIISIPVKKKGIFHLSEKYVLFLKLNLIARNKRMIEETNGVEGKRKILK